MKNKYVFTAVLLVCLTALSFLVAALCMQTEETKEEGLSIVTSFYPVYVATQNVVGDCEGVTVSCLSEPQTGCLHDYQLTSQDMVLLSTADIFVVNGGGIEEFLTQVAEAYPDLIIVDAGESIFSEELIVGVIQGDADATAGESTDAADADAAAAESADDTDLDVEEDAAAEDAAAAEGADDMDSGADSEDDEENAHVWLSFSYYKRQIEAISVGLSAADPERAAQYQANAAAYESKIDALWQEAEELLAYTTGVQVILLHEALEYLTEDYGMVVAGAIDLDEERQISAGEVASIVDVMKEQEITINFAEETYGASMAKTLEAETGATAYFLNTLLRGDGD